MIPLEAPPGVSNHSNGLAVGSVYYGANSDVQEQWRELWLYHWLKKNGKRFNFKQLPSEEWHWDYVGS
jgi:LAS superfamily LD-carboxypeptidase LdcB